MTVWSSLVFGCPDIAPPPNTWMRKEENKVVIGCHSGPEMWEMKCVGNHWIGVTGNCTKSELKDTKTQYDKMW